jgi:HAE1 family hydrophobic/amphiphilic exporter-1
MGQNSNNVSEINVALVPRNKRSKSIDEVSEAIKKNASVISGIKVRVSPIGLFGTGDSFSIGITLTGDNFSNVYDSAGKVENIMKHVKGVAEVKMTTTQGKPEMRININRERMALYGLTLDNVGGTLRAALSGDDESKYREGDNEYNIRILLDQFDRSSTNDIGKIKVTNLMGQQIELRQFADIVPDIGPNQLRRQDRSTSIAVLCQINGRPSGDVGADIQKGIKKETFPDGVTIREEGDTQMQSESFASLGFALMIAILFVYLIMVALYNSFVYPFVVLFSIPVAIVGALIALALTMKTLNIFSILGIIMLVGLVGKNAILLVDRANKNKENGLGIVESLVEAGKTRLRPIVMTSFAMILGMMPIALAFGGGAAEIKSSLGVALVGGLTSSMFLTLLLVPVVYMIFENIKNRFTAKKNKQE